MTRSSLARLVGIAVGITVSLAGPVMALAHARAHSEAIEHASHHGVTTPAESLHPSIGDGGHDGEHAHPRLDPSVFTRSVKDLPAVRSPTVAFADASIVTVQVQDAPAPTESPPHRASTSPPQSRAPPVL